jgi:type I restriction enzyme, R subunit
MKNSDPINAIEEKLKQAGWDIQNAADINLRDSRAVAVRDFSLIHLAVDFLLFVDQNAVGIIQTTDTASGIPEAFDEKDESRYECPKYVPHTHNPLPFFYFVRNQRILYKNTLDPEPQFKSVFDFHRGQTLIKFLSDPATLKKRLMDVPPFHSNLLWNCQSEALVKIEKSIVTTPYRTFVRMASGTGKTFVAFHLAYRLLKYAKAERILYLVDRAHLSRSIHDQFAGFRTPDDDSLFTERYPVRVLNGKTLDSDTRIYVSTIQRLAEFFSDGVEPDDGSSLYEKFSAHDFLQEMIYADHMPIESFDFIIIDDCHYSLLTEWRPLLEYFDARIIGLFSSPFKQAVDFFNGNLVFEYGHSRAVADGIHVDIDSYEVNLVAKAAAISLSKNYSAKESRQKRWSYQEGSTRAPKEFKPEFIKKPYVVKACHVLKSRFLTDFFPGRSMIPKTVIFAQDDAHAETIAHSVNKIFGKGPDFCKCVSVRKSNVEEILQQFRWSNQTRMLVTDDLITTGEDLPMVEALIFMRSVHSRLYLEQMIGRGIRTVRAQELQNVTSDAKYKSYCVLVDISGEIKSINTELAGLDRKSDIPFDELIYAIDTTRHDDIIVSIAGRLARLNTRLTEGKRREIERTIFRKPMGQIIHALLDVVDPDVHEEIARELFNADSPDPQQLVKAHDELVSVACEPFQDHKVRDQLIQLYHKIYTEHQLSGSEPAAETESDMAGNSKKIIETFRRFIYENKSKNMVVKTVWRKSGAYSLITMEQLKKLSDMLKRDPYRLKVEQIWQAYAHLKGPSVKTCPCRVFMTDIIPLIQFEAGIIKILEAFAHGVERRYQGWCHLNEKNGKKFIPAQLDFLETLKNCIAENGTIAIEDLDFLPQYHGSGTMRMYQLFGNEMTSIIQDLNKKLMGHN